MENILEIWLKQGQTVIHNSLLEHYRAVGLSETELVFVIQLQSCLDRNILFPNLNMIAERMGKEESEIFSVLHALIQKKAVSIQTEKDENGKVSDRYSLDPLYKKIFFLISREEKQQKESESEIDLLSVFQKEFGRLLTPIEMQTIGEWLDRDHYSKEMITEALREAVLNQKYSLRYIDRILMSWEKKNIRTSQQVKQESKNYANLKMGTAEESPSEEDIPFFNWLDPEQR